MEGNTCHHRATCAWFAIGHLSKSGRLLIMCGGTEGKGNISVVQTQIFLEFTSVSTVSRNTTGDTN